MTRAAVVWAVLSGVYLFLAVLGQFSTMPLWMSWANIGLGIFAAGVSSILTELGGSR